jgi:hypothetical protein
MNKEYMGQTTITIKELLDLVDSGKVGFMGDDGEVLSGEEKTRQELSKQVSEKDDNSEPPFTQLKNNGCDILRDDNNDIVVGIGKSLCNSEGFTPRESVEGLRMISVSEEDITDYNSLWEITKTGWNSKEVTFPYVCIDDEWYRWDEKSTLRKNNGLMKWSTENTSRYMGYIMSNPNESPFGGDIMTFRDSPKNRVKNKYRNKPCPCGSGKKYKKCCSSLGGKE